MGIKREEAVVDMEQNSGQIPYIRYTFCGSMPTNIGEVIRNAVHDRLLSATRRFRGVDLTVLSDYEYFRAVCVCFADWTGTLIAEADTLMFRSVFGIPEEPSPQNCDTLWTTCNDIIAEQAQDNATTYMDLCGYFTTPDRLSARTLAEQEQEICDGIARLAHRRNGFEENGLPADQKTVSRLVCRPNALVCMGGRMPAVFRRPDPHHAELAFRKCLSGKQTPEERDLLYAQLLRTAARQCAEHRIPLLFENISPDFCSFYRYAQTEAGDTVMLARIDEVTFRFWGEETVCPVISDADVAERLLPYFPAVSLIYLPPSDERGAASYASQLCFRRRFLELTENENKKYGAGKYLRAVCHDNLSALLER